MVAIETLSSSISGTGGRHLQGWRLDRVSLPNPHDGAAAGPVLEFHPRLTVIFTGRAPLVADHLATVLHQAGSGVHVEFTLSTGVSFVLFRPLGARHRLVDINAGQERSLPETLQTMAPLTRPGRADHSDETVDPNETAQHVVGQLSRIDQVVLWTAADRLLAARAAAPAPSFPNASHAPTPPALAPAPDLAPGADRSPVPPSISRRRLFQRRRDVPPTEHDGGVARELAEADRYWRLFAGDIDVAAALRQRPRIEAASGLRARLGALATVGRAPEAGEPHQASLDPLDVPTLVCAVVPEQDHEAGPHLLTVPGDAGPDAASMLLEQLANAGLDRQLVIVTSAEVIADWARLESHVRRATLVQWDGPPG